MSAQSMKSRPRRSCLYMPGANERALEKAKSIAADTLLLDLEDAVAPDAKVEARDRVCEAVKAGGYGKREIIIRMNGLDTQWGAEDLEAAVAAGPNGILAPKVSSAAEVHALDEALTKAGASADFSLWIMIETPLSILNLHEISACASTTRLTTFVMGTNDLAKDMRAMMTPDRIAFQTQLTMAVTAARAYGITAIDGVFNDIKNSEGFEAECQQGRVMGFDGKTLIHPAQVETCNTVFSPSEADVAQAQDVIAAFADPENAGKGVLKVNGKMTEILHLEEAKRLIEMEKAIQSLIEG
ncbi:HpcH/HpaI aldolase/citrate lyase family protein [Hirschia maritima]|uniref:HpcH/HpaI aldolase/citrate lyase family protein n=1 Tax=Hirschia maritima TaxID=1121961 RepID=UPI0003626C50|nr:CoA ester lyase [Hirschia maritima]